MTKTAIMIPCYNEAITIAKVVSDFREALPEAEIHVFDNASSDNTGEEASRAGAILHYVAKPGKGNVVRAMFREVDADVYVMVDGDDTYPANRVRDLIAPVLEQHIDMVVGTRLAEYEPDSYRPLHVLGNKLVLTSINLAFGARLTDVLSGYRAFSRNFVKTMPVLSRGFEIETEMTLHALANGFSTSELAISYGSRPEGSTSKLNTIRDGYRVLKTVFWLFKDHRPLVFFGWSGMLAILLGAAIGVAVIEEFLAYRQVLGAARAVLSVSLCLAGALSLTTGLILDTVNRRSRELYVLISDQMSNLDKLTHQ